MNLTSNNRFLFLTFFKYYDVKLFKNQKMYLSIQLIVVVGRLETWILSY